MSPHLTLLATLAVLAIPGAASPAQHNSTFPSADRPAIVRELESEIGGAAFDFWTPRLNDYKNRIDQALTGDDLAELNRLRVRWAIIIDQGIRHSPGIRNGDTASVRFDVESMEHLQEVMSIYTAAKKLSLRYRPDMDRLSTDVLDDIVVFAGNMADRADRFVEANRSTFESDPEASAMLERRGDLNSAVEKLRSDRGRQGLASVYSFAIEPVIMLYDGTDLKTLLTGAMPSGVTVGGMEIPEASALRQNVPNPASSSTSIHYALAFSSSATVLEIFNAGGELVASYDQGARDAGEYDVNVDVSHLPSGSYVYRLTSTTTKGPRVHSKVMQVVR